MFHATEGTVRDEPAASGIAESVAAMANIDHVIAVVSPLGPDGAGLVSDDGTIAYAEVRFDVPAQDTGPEAVTALEAAGDHAVAAGVQVEYGGDVVASNSRGKPPSSELIGLAVAVVVLLVAFGSVIAMGLPLITAIFGLGIGLSLITLLTATLDLNSSGPIIATMIGLGVGIDYALFVVTRHRQFLHEGMTVPEAAARANATSGSAVVFAGVTVVIAILGLQIAGIPAVTAMGIASAIVVAVMVLVAVILLPALLGIVGRRIDSLSVPGLKPKVEAAGHDTFGAKWAKLVAAPPVVVGHPGGLAPDHLGRADSQPSPRFDRCGDRAAELDTAACLRLADRRLRPRLQRTAHLGHRSAGGRPVVARRSTSGSADRPERRACLAAGGQPGGRHRDPHGLHRQQAPGRRRPAETVHRLRNDVIPPVVEQDGGHVYVTGSTAAFIDLSDKITQRLPWFMAAVIGLSFLLLMTVFRSVLIALKAAIMNVLAIGAAYGAVVAIFQWGWFGSLFGVEESLPIISFLPMMMFAILFGLSMDYEVFILSRIREEWLKSGDTQESVVKGISATARVITSAALIMISVFAAFILGDNPLIKMFGFGMAFAVFIDATVVRMVLVPATMELLGDRNWWLPGWLDRILPRINIEGETNCPRPNTCSSTRSKRSKSRVPAVTTTGR